MSTFTNWPWLDGLILSKATSIKKGCCACQWLDEVDMLHPCGDHLLRKVGPLGSLVCNVFFCFVTFSNNTPDPGHQIETFPCGVFGQVWYLIVWTLYICLFRTITVCKVWSKYTVRFKSYMYMYDYFHYKTTAKMMLGNTLSSFAYFSLTDHGQTDGLT